MVAQDNCQQLLEQNMDTLHDNLTTLMSTLQDQVSSLTPPPPPPPSSPPISTYATEPLIIPPLITTTQTHGSSPLATVPQTLIISYPYGMPSHFSINHSLTLPFPNVPSMFPTGSISFSTSQPHSPHTSSSLTHTRPPFPYPIFTTITTPNMTPSIPHFSFSFFITQP
ncbi:hypothetical protein AAZX31_10G094300 [Glycine max]